MKRGEIYVLTGCTAVGKTEVALQWAEYNNAEIVSCDSLLFYRGMDIGTAKPAAEELARVRHHLVDICEPNERMNVNTYLDLARRAVDAIARCGKRVLVVGGSGFYLRSFFAPVTDDVPVDEALRSSLEQRLASEGLETLVRELECLNPRGLGPLDRKNPRRVLRALERCLVSGRPLYALARDFGNQRPPFADRTFHVTVLARADADLKARIARRTNAMLAAGLVEEVRALQTRGLESNPSACRAIGYREVLSWMDSGKGVADLAEEINRNTWRLVRKQRAWFRSQLPAHHIVTLGAGPAPAALFV